MDVVRLITSSAVMELPDHPPGGMLVCVPWLQKNTPNLQVGHGGPQGRLSQPVENVSVAYIGLYRDVRLFLAFVHRNQGGEVGPILWRL